jgi:hypothetical protein
MENPQTLNDSFARQRVSKFGPDKTGGLQRIPVSRTSTEFRVMPICELQATAESVTLPFRDELPQVKQNDHPLASLFGKYKDEPLWDEFMQGIQDYRNRKNQEPDIE